MGANLNKVILVGNLTRDPETKAAGTLQIADVGLAINERVKRGEEWVEETLFVDVTLFGKQAEIAGQYLTKGSSVLIEGRLKLETWNDKTSGDKRSKMKVVGERMQMLGGKGEGGPKKPDPAKGEVADADIPF